MSNNKDIHILRIYQEGGTGGEGWHEVESNPYTPNDIKKISDPTGGTDKKEITSIPSPFARLHLHETAFKAVTSAANRRDGVDLDALNGNSLYHKIISDSLDVAQIFFKFDLLKLSNPDRDITVHKWNLKDRVQRIKEYGTENQRLLAETLELFWERDGDNSKFSKVDALHLLTIDYQMIGGTSPSTLFFSTANDKTFVNFREGEDTFFDDEYFPLYKRTADIRFLKYLFGLFELYENLQVDMPLFYNYLEANRKALRQYNETIYGEIESFIRSITQAKFHEEFDRWDNSSPVFVHRGIEHLKKNVEDPGGANDFHIKSVKFTDPKKPLVLQNGFARGLKYFGGAWNPQTIVPFKVDTHWSERICPGQDVKYPYLVVSDFLESTLMELPYGLDDTYFFSGNRQDFFYGDQNSMDYPDNGFLIPITKLYFDFFDIQDLKDQLRIIKINDDSIKVELKIPISKDNENIVFERIYTRGLAADEASNQGAIEEAPISIGITPFSVDNEANHQIVGLIDATTDNYDLTFYRNYPDSCQILNEHNKDYKTTKRSDINEHSHNATSTYHIMDKNYDLIQVSCPSKDHNGFFVPIIRNRIDGKKGVKFVFAIDFGTTNTHVEYKRDGQNPMSFEILGPNDGQDDRQLITSVDSFWRCRDYPMLFDLLEREISPIQISDRGKYRFPTRTVVSEIQGFNHNSTMYPVADISIPYGYESLAKLGNEVYTTNLKWQPLSDDNMAVRNEKRVKAFIESLMIQIRNKILMNGGKLEDTDIIWFYPSSMKTNQISKYRRIWTEAYQKYFNKRKKPIEYSESEAPFYIYYGKGEVNAHGAPVLNIDIGGGTTDIVVFEEEDPKFLTSFKFAGDACFGDAYAKVSSAQNGFVKQFRGTVENFLSQNQTDLFDLYQVFQQLTNVGSSRSADIMAFFFSLENSNYIKDKDLDFSITKRIADNEDFKIIFIIFFSAIIYHIAKLMHKFGLAKPGYICLSGNGSKIVNLLDEDPDLEVAAKLAQLIFEKVYDEQYGGMNVSSLRIIQSDQPKRATCQGGLMKTGGKSSFDKLVLLGDEIGTYINNNRVHFDSNLVKYSELGDQISVPESGSHQDGEPTSEKLITMSQSVVNEVHHFADLVIDLNKEFSYENYFGLDITKLEDYRRILKSETLGRINQGIADRLGNMNNKDSEIEETLFFYPLVIGLFEMTKFIHGKGR